MAAASACTSSLAMLVPRPQVAALRLGVPHDAHDDARRGGLGKRAGQRVDGLGRRKTSLSKCAAGREPRVDEHRADWLAGLRGFGDDWPGDPAGPFSPAKDRLSGVARMPQN